VITILKLMQTKLDHIVRTTLARPSLKEADREELLMLTHEFPYSSVLQFLYTKRLQQSQDPRFGDSVTRTALFFNNPHWLYQQLRDIPAVEQVSQEEGSVTADHLPGQLADAGHLETLEYEADPVHELSPAEQALIASLTEAPDGSIRPDADEERAMENTESEAAYIIPEAPDTDPEIKDPEPDPSLTEAKKQTNAPTDLTAALSIGESATSDLSSVLPVIEEPAALVMPAEMPEEDIQLDVPDAEITPDGPAHTTETVDDVAFIDEKTEPDTDIPAPVLPEFDTTVPEEAIAAPADDLPVHTIEDENGSTDIEIPDEARSATDELPNTDDTPAAEVPFSSLITVISSAGPQDVHTIHTIGNRDTERHVTPYTDLPALKEELPTAPVEEIVEVPENGVSDNIEPAYVESNSDNDDDAAISHDDEQAPVPGTAGTAEPAYAEYQTDNDDDVAISNDDVITPEPVASNTSEPAYAEYQTDNDDDAAISNDDVITPEPVAADTTEPADADTEKDNHDDTSPVKETFDADDASVPGSATGVASFTEEAQPSGLEHLGFLPETLLEESDAAEEAGPLEGGVVHAEPEFHEGWEADMHTSTDETEDPDHPDSTDAGELPAHDEDLPVINPGDLIRMAGLDQYNETELSFEPLHLTDYFASVGVSLPPDEQPDVFSRQSRSFKGWIRSMKRIHPEKSTVPFSPSESELIRSVADQSNEQEDVLTETMAEIYAMQGLTHKAIDIYEKLSLLNPDKSAIFAAKLSELKGRSS
jgi:hypothetical protein